MLVFSPAAVGTVRTGARFSALCLGFLTRKLGKLAVATHKGCCRNSLRLYVQRDKASDRDTGAIVILWLLLFFPRLKRENWDSLEDLVKEPRDAERGGRLSFGDT